MSQVRTPKARTKSEARPEAMSLDAYRELVRRVMTDAVSKNTRMARVFSNTGAAHARIVLEAMLGTAAAKVDIFCRELNTEVWDPGWFDALLTRESSVKVRVLVDVDADITAEQSALRKLQPHIRAGALRIRRLANPTNASHMTVVDGRHIRAEVNHDERKAVVSFGDEEMAAVASKSFDVLWGVGSPL